MCSLQKYFGARRNEQCHDQRLADNARNHGVKNKSKPNKLTCLVRNEIRNECKGEIFSLQKSGILWFTPISSIVKDNTYSALSTLRMKEVGTKRKLLVKGRGPHYHATSYSESNDEKTDSSCYSWWIHNRLVNMAFCELLRLKVKRNVNKLSFNMKYIAFVYINKT